MAKTSAREVLKKILLSFKRNWGLKLVSLFFALLLWNYVIVTVDPIRTVTYGSVAMEPASGMATLNSLDLTVKGDIAAYLKNVSVTIDLHRKEQQGFTKDNIRAWIDLSGISTEGKHDLKVNVQATRGTVKSWSPQTISVTVERLETIEVPVSIATTGVLPADYWMGEASVSPATLKISGAMSEVEKVRKAVVQIPLSGLKSDFSSSSDFSLLDADGLALPAAGLKMDPPNCLVSFPVLPTKLVLIDASNAFKGVPAKGYQVDGQPVLSADRIRIAAPAAVLESISSLPLNAVDISGAKNNTTSLATVQLPGGVYAVAGNSVTIVVKIAMKTVTQNMSGLPIEITGLADGMKADRAYAGSVTFTCPELYVSSLKASSMHLRADASGKGAGIQTLTVTASYDDPQAGVTGITVDAAQIDVSIIPAR